MQEQKGATKRRSIAAFILWGAVGFFPKKGHEVTAGSPVDKVIQTGKTHLVNHIAFSEDVDDGGLVAIAQPVMLPASHLFSRLNTFELIYTFSIDRSRLRWMKVRQEYMR